MGGIALANGIAFGTIYTFGVFFDAMADEFDAGSGATAFIFGLTLLLFFGFGIVSGPISDRVGVRPTLVVGGVIFLSGLVATSVVDSLVLGWCTYALVGLGGGCFAAPLTGLAGLLFDRHRAAALGVVATGNGLGTMLLIPLARWLIDRDDWRIAMRWLAVVAAVGFVLAAVALVPAPSAARGAASAHDDRGPAADPVFRRLFVAGTLMSIGLFTAFAFIVSFAKANGVDGSTASWVMSTVGIASIVGRLALTGLAERAGALRLLQLTLFVQPFVYGLWYLAQGSVPLLLIFAVALGVVYGGFVALTPEVAIVLFGPARIGRLMGALFLAFGVGGFIGPPLAGLLEERSSQRTVIVVVILVVALAGLVMATVKPQPASDLADAAATR